MVRLKPDATYTCTAVHVQGALARQEIEQLRGAVVEDERGDARAGGGADEYDHGGHGERKRPLGALDARGPVLLFLEMVGPHGGHAPRRLPLAAGQAVGVVASEQGVERVER